MATRTPDVANDVRTVTVFATSRRSVPPCFDGISRMDCWTSPATGSAASLKFRRSYRFSTGSASFSRSASSFISGTPGPVTTASAMSPPPLPVLLLRLSPLVSFDLVERSPLGQLTG